jgi:hypothetical protein
VGVWVIIIAGHLYADPITGQTVWNHNICMGLAAAIGGQCVQMPVAPPDTPSDGGVGLKEGCIASGACKLGQ